MQSVYWPWNTNAQATCRLISETQVQLRTSLVQEFTISRCGGLFKSRLDGLQPRFKFFWYLLAFQFTYRVQLNNISPEYSFMCSPQCHRRGDRSRIKLKYSVEAFNKSSWMSLRDKSESFMTHKESWGLNTKDCQTTRRGSWSVHGAVRIDTKFIKWRCFWYIIIWSILQWEWWGWE